MPSVEEELAARLARGEEVVLATVIKLDGEPPSRTGAKLLLSRNAAIAGITKDPTERLGRARDAV